MHIDICNTMQCVMEYLMLKTKQIDMNINEINIQIKVLQSIYQCTHHIYSYHFTPVISCKYLTGYDSFDPGFAPQILSSQESTMNTIINYVLYKNMGLHFLPKHLTVNPDENWK